MTKVMRGVIHGKTIELASNTGLADGRQVEIILRVKELPGPPAGWRPGNAETAAGMMASSWTTDDDQIMDEILKQRRDDPRREISE
jgi:hypothetical protein